MRPLDHLTVIDLTVNVPGPYCSTVLCDLGARVIKVEPPGGDPLRSGGSMWASLNRGKESIVLDLKADGAREALIRLAERADVVLEGWRPGVAKRLGADYRTLSRRNPGLVYCSISGFGQEGPWRDRPGHDVNYLALSGYLAVQSMVEGRPWPPPVLISDLASGLHAAVAVLAAIAGRQVSGKGAYIDLSMTEAALSLLGLEIHEAAVGEVLGAQPNVTFIPHYGVFPCADGRWISLGIVHEDHFWRRFCHVAGLDDLGGLEYNERIARASELRPAAEWESALLRADVPAATVMDLEETFHSPQLQARKAFRDLSINRYVKLPVRFSTASVTPMRGPPELGEQTDTILAELGLGAG